MDSWPDAEPQVELPRPGDRDEGMPRALLAPVGRRSLLAGAAALLVGCSSPGQDAPAPSLPTTAQNSPSTAVPSRTHTSTASASASATPTRSGTPSPSHSPTPSAASSSSTRLTGEQLAQVVRDAVGERADRVGIGLVDRRTGATWSQLGEVEFEMASVAKLLIVLATIRRRERDGTSLGETDRLLVSRALRHSDNDSAQKLWVRAGGLDGMRRTAEAFAMPTTAASVARLDTWGLAMTTPKEFVGLLTALASGGAGVVSPSACRYVEDEMRQVTPIQAWGVGSAGTPEHPVAVKNGWLPDEGWWHVNSVGHVQVEGRDHLLALFQRRATSEQGGIETLDRVAAGIHRALASELAAD